MGNPKMNSTDRAELQVLPNRDGQGSSSDSKMRDEVYAPKDLKETEERVQASAEQVAERLGKVTQRLENAAALLTHSGPDAGKEYLEAIKSADRINQDLVSREIQNIKQLLQNRNLDLQTRRLLVQENADLQTLQRAPGFTRANMALALIRNGEQASGTQLLLDAQKRDSAMYGDPNFQRHFNNAFAAATNQKAAQYTSDQRETAQPAGLLPPRDLPPLPPPPPPPPPARDIPLPPTPNYQQPRDISQQSRDAQPTRDAQPLRDQPTAGTAAAALADVEQKFKSVVEQRGDVRAAYQQLAPGYLAAIQKADAEFTSANAQTSARDQQLEAAINAKLTPAVKAQLQQIGAQIQDEKRNLSPASLDLWNKYYSGSTTDGDRQAIQTQLQKTMPKMAQLANQLESTMGKETFLNMMVLASDQEKMQGALNGRFLSRYHFAATADIAGDRQNAQSQLKSAFEAVTPDVQQYYAQRKSDVQEMAGRVGVDLRLLPAPPDSVLATALTGTNRQQSDSPRPSGTAGDVIQQPVSGLSPENVGLRADQIFDDAKRSFQQAGMTEQTKKLFADAIKVADSLFGPEDQQITKSVLTVLQTGRKLDGSALTVDERCAGHKAMQQEFERATLGMQYRMIYGQILNQSKQYASAEKVFKENIAVTDNLPLTTFQAELTQLGKDVQNRDIDRNSQRDLFKMMQSIQGDGTSRDDGLLYMPITSRKQAALFYTSGADGSGTGLVKPEQAAAMIDDAIAKEKSLYGVEPDKVKRFDPRLASMAQAVIPLLPETVRNMKMKADSFWSDFLVDGSVAAVAISGTMFIAGVLTKNGTLAKMGLASTEGTLNLGGKALVGTSILGGATFGRHEVHKLITGESESWDKSLIHGTAGVGEVAALMGVRSLASKVLYSGPKATAETMLTRFHLERSVVAGEHAAVAPTVGDFFAQMGSNGRMLTAEQAALKGSVAPLVESGVVNAEAAAALKDLTQPQLVSLTQTFLKEGALESSRWYAPGNLYATSKNLVPGQLDLTTASAANLRVRSFYGNYASAFAALGTYSSITSLDRGIDPNTGELMSYADSFVKSNYRSAIENTAFEALCMSLFPIMKDGAFAKNMYAKGASSASKGWGYFTAPFRPSALNIGALGEGASYGQLGLKTAQMNVITTLTNGSTYQRWIEGGKAARALGHKLDAMGEPVEDQSAPQAIAPDTTVLNASNSPTRETNASSAPVQDNGQPIEDQQSELTRGTPGL